MNEYVKIGHTQKPHGLKGELKVNIEDSWYDRLEGVEAFFVKLKGQLTPYFLEYIRGNDGNIAKFEEIETREIALTLASRELYVRENDLTPAKEEEEYYELEYDFCEGYDLVDSVSGLIGTIEEILEYPQQEMARIVDGSKEILVPLHEALIVSIDEEKQVIIVNLPEGFMDLFENEEE